MRAVLSTLLALQLAAAFVAPHVHLDAREGGPGHEPCAVCLTRTADVARSEAPDLAPSDAVVGEVVPRPEAAPVTGAPLGAVPGQSPPA